MFNIKAIASICNFIEKAAGLLNSLLFSQARKAMDKQSAKLVTEEANHRQRQNYRALIYQKRIEASLDKHYTKMDKLEKGTEYLRTILG